MYVCMYCMYVCICVHACVCMCVRLCKYSYCSYQIEYLLFTGPIIPYPNNPLNPAIHLEKSVNFSCGTWVSEYAQLHNGEF